MRSFDISDAEIQIMSSINLKVLPHLAHPQSAVGCNAQQCWPMWLSGYHRLWFRFFLYVQLVSILSDHIVQANVVQFDDDFTGLGAVVGMLLQCTFKSFCHSVSIQAKRRKQRAQKDESRWQSTDSSKAYRNTSAFKCLWISVKINGNT